MKIYDVVPILVTLIILLHACCSPTIFSPHCQNELLPFYNYNLKVSEMGIGMAYNRWLVQKDSGFDYIRLYPAASFNHYYQRFYPFERFHYLLGLETYVAPGSAWKEGKSGFILELHPYLGVQLSHRLLSLRAHISPVDLAGGFYEDEWFCEPSLVSLFTLFQISFLFHNPTSSKPRFWIGTRASPGAWAGIAGVEYQFNPIYCLRLEYSYLLPNNFLSKTWVLDLGTIEGSVHYLTLALFKKL